MPFFPENAPHPEAARSDRYYPLWALLLMGGLRPGEAFGLKWEDVDFAGGKVHVRRTLTRRGLEGQTWKLVAPKTRKARRVVVLPPVAMLALRQWKVKQEDERLLLGEEYEDYGLVFATEFGKPLDGGNLCSRKLAGSAQLRAWASGRLSRFLDRAGHEDKHASGLRSGCTTFATLVRLCYSSGV
jgi:integrase